MTTTMRITAEQYAASVTKSDLQGVDRANERLVYGMRILEAGSNRLHRKEMNELRRIAKDMMAGTARSRDELVEKIMREARHCDWTVQTYAKI